MGQVSCTYNPFFEGFDVYAGPVAEPKDMDYFGAAYFKRNRKQSAVEFDDSVLEVRPGFIGCFPTIRQIILSDRMEKFELSEEEKAFLRGRGGRKE